MVVAARASGRRGFARRSRRNPGQSGGLQAAPAPYTDGHRVRGTGCLLPVARTCTAGRCEGYDRAPATRAGRWVDSRCAPDRRGETRSSRSAPHLARSRRMRAAVAMPASSGVRVPEVSQLREFTPTTATPRCGHATLRPRHAARGAWRSPRPALANRRRRSQKWPACSPKPPAPR